MGRVVNGKVEVEEALDEGTVVTILASEDRETFALGPEAEAALFAAIEEADQGKVVSGEEVLRGLRRG
jgi:peptide subunit release factor 1 (eRF1)